MELTLEVPQSTIDIIKGYAAEHGDPTDLVNSAAISAIELALNTDQRLVSFALRPSAIQKLNAYAHLKGASKEDVALEVSETLSDTLEKILTDRIADELGLSTTAPAVVQAKNRRGRQQVAHQNFTDTTGISNGLGDDDTEPEMPPAETSETALLPATGGLTDKDLEEDMQVDNPAQEAKGEASFGEDMEKANGGGENLFAEVAGFDKEYVDPRVAKRRKGPTKSKGRVKPLTTNVESESAEI